MELSQQEYSNFHIWRAAANLIRKKLPLAHHHFSEDLFLFAGAMGWCNWNAFSSLPRRTSSRNESTKIPTTRIIARFVIFLIAFHCDGFFRLSYHIALLLGRNVMRFWEARKWNSSKRFTANSSGGNFMDKYFERKILIPWTLSKLPFLHITQLTQQCSSRSDDERWRISHLLRSFFHTYIFNVRVIKGGWPGREEWKKCSVTVSSTVFSVRVPN